MFVVVIEHCFSVPWSIGEGSGRIHLYLGKRSPPADLHICSVQALLGLVLSCTTVIKTALHAPLFSAMISVPLKSIHANLLSA